MLRLFQVLRTLHQLPRVSLCVLVWNRLLMAGYVN